MEKIIIGLTGPEGVGKSTFSKKLKSILQNDFNVKCLAFADSLYKSVSFLLDVPVETLKSQDYKNLRWTKETAPLYFLEGWTPREFVRKYATEAVRDNIHPNFWVEKTLKECTEKINIIEDARFNNEFEVCHIVIELQREGVQYIGGHSSSLIPNRKYIWKTIDVMNINDDEFKTQLKEKINEI
jgi:energy-coupling factor transporter ATP-binding protein EcfA2